MTEDSSRPPEYYGIWSQKEIVDFYRSKSKADFFASDTYFLSRIAPEVHSIFDVGCAAGRLLEVFKGFNYRASYRGLDIVPENITAARELYPDHEFVVGDAVTYRTDERFDLVYSAGTMFHVPQYEAAIENMLAWSKRFVGFEVKLGATADHIIDRDIAYSKIGDSKAFMVVLNLWSFLEWLTARPGIGRIQLLGYKTPINRATVVPVGIEHFVSCCVFIEKGCHLHEVSIDLPMAALQRS